MASKAWVWRIAFPTTRIDDTEYMTRINEELKRRVDRAGATNVRYGIRHEGLRFMDPETGELLPLASMAFAEGVVDVDEEEETPDH